MAKAVLAGGPQSGQRVEVPRPLPMDLIVEDSKYIFWHTCFHATFEGTSEHTVYAFSHKIEGASK